MISPVVWLRPRPRSLRWAVLPLLAFALAACSPGAQGGAASWPGVSAGEDRVYVAHGPAVYAVDLEGNELWHYPQEPVRDLTFYAGPAVSDDGMVYAGGYDGHVYALEAETGKVQWEFPSADGSQATSDGRIVASPTIAGDLLLVPTDGGTLFFLDRQTGETLRTFDAVGPLWSAPRVEGDTAYLASLSHTLYAIDLTSAEQRWSVDLGYAIADSPTLEASLLLTGVLGDSLVALRAQDGNQSWTIPTAGWLWGSPAVQDGLAYFGDATPTGWTTKDGQGNVYAVDLTSRETIWQKPTAAVSNSPLIVDGRLIVGFENGELIAYDLADGTVVWDALAAGPIQGDPVVADGKLIVGVTSPKTVLQAFDSATGDSAWTFPAVTDS